MNIKGEEHNDLCVGIDLGTTNSVLSIINVKLNGDIISKVVEIPRAVDTYTVVEGAKFNTQRKPTLPSCVYYDDEHYYKTVVGDFAKKRYPVRPHLVAKSIKSQMGNEFATGLSPEVPDKTPAQISARILEHMLRHAEKIFRTKIDDAVITVPANFDSSMCRATRDAAEIAGIKIKNNDDSERPVLLSEPNAVIYDFINQAHNGEIPANVLDLSKKKHVMVFDLGGGTLDITLHAIERRDSSTEILKVKEIATNRYTLLGGDDFDKAIAEAMFRRYVKQHERHVDIVNKLRREKKTIMPQLLVYAEELKLELSDRKNDDIVSSGWDEDEEDNDFPIGGNISSTGYAYDDTFTVEEIEEILSPFMGTHLTFDDYKKLDELTGDNNTRNIIYPILDVLNKAAEKLNTNNVVIDAVIMNGGMSKFYMITERLKQFFGFDPIVALDPDQAVARGAAVYHYYLHRYEEIKDDMRLVGDTESAKSAADKKFESDDGVTLLKPPLSIEWGRNILNDSLYLATKNDTQVKIIPSGAELPYTSEMMKGFKLMPNYKQIAIPILSRNIDSTYRVIARGNIVFTRKYPDGAYVAFRVYMASSKVITMEAWTCNDVDGTQILEQGRVDISIHNDFSAEKKNKIVPRVGTNLKPEAVLNNIEQLCRNYENLYGKALVAKKSAIAKEIRMLVNSVCTAGNAADFAVPVLKMIGTTRSNEFKQRCFIIARKIGGTWTDDQKRQLANECMLQLDSELQGINLKDYWSSSASTNTKMQAIFAMSMCASPEQLNKLEKLHSDERYLNSCLYTHAKTKTQVDWIYNCFKRDVGMLRRGLKSNIQFSSYSIGLAFHLDGRPLQTKVDKDAVVGELCEMILSQRISIDESICCMLALGWICDRRQKNDVSQRSIDEALRTLDDMNFYYTSDEKRRLFKMQSVVRKLIQGQELSRDEEEFLLLKLSGFDS